MNGSTSSFVEDLAAKQLEAYRQLPDELRAHDNREQAALDAYRGRQLLELLQNSDDSAAGSDGECSLLLDLSRERLVVANKGKPFSEAGIRSLVISDCSSKQDRNRFIGCKGLGFRSVLAWTEEPLVFSGAHAVAFSRSHSLAAAEALCGQMPSVPQEIAEFRRAWGRYPAAIMRFPYVPIGGAYATTAASLRAIGFDTVIILPLPTGVPGDKVHGDIAMQLKSLNERALLFCRHLTRVELVGDLKREWTLLRQQRVANLQDVILTCDGQASLWTVHSPDPGRLELEPDQGAKVQNEFELSVAVPELVSPNPDATLCVFFPTQERVQCSLALHATLETTDDRNHIVDTSANRAVLERLGDTVADVLESEAREAREGQCDRALALLAGIQRSPGPLNLREAVLGACQTRRIFPRVDGTLERLTAIRRAPHAVWLADEFVRVLPEMLDERAADGETKALLGCFNTSWFDPSTLKTRLQSMVQQLLPDEAGELIGKLVAAKELPDIDITSLMIAADGALLEDRGRAFFPPTSDLPPLPAWANSVRFVHPSFHAGLLRGTGSGTTRTLSAETVSGNRRIDEYRFDTVANALIEEASRAPDDASGLWRDVLAWLFAAWRAGAQVTADLRMQLQTTAGTTARATECYFGPAYARGLVASKLYEQFGIPELVASPADVGLPDGVEQQEHVAEFLEALGVASVPRMKPLSWSESRQIVEAVVDRLDYPYFIRGQSVKSPAELRALCREYDIPNLHVPDRMPALLDSTETSALVAYLLSPSGAALLANESDASVTFQVKFKYEQHARSERSITIPNAAVFLLRERAWVPGYEWKNAPTASDCPGPPSK